jgi:hypothetical protein
MLTEGTIRYRQLTSTVVALGNNEGFGLTWRSIPIVFFFSKE